jgi:dynein heavy chain
VIDKLAKSNCSSVNDFEWVSQLRFYWDRELNDCVVKQVGARRWNCVCTHERAQ